MPSIDFYERPTIQIGQYEVIFNFQKKSLCGIAALEGNTAQDEFNSAHSIFFKHNFPFKYNSGIKTFFFDLACT